MDIYVINPKHIWDWFSGNSHKSIYPGLILNGLAYVFNIITMSIEISDQNLSKPQVYFPTAIIQGKLQPPHIWL